MATEESPQLSGGNVQIIRRKSDNIVLYAGADLSIGEIAALGVGWCDTRVSTATCDVYTVASLPAGYIDECWTYIGGVWAVVSSKQPQVDVILNTPTLTVPILSAGNIAAASMLTPDGSLVSYVSVAWSAVLSATQYEIRYKQASDTNWTATSALQNPGSLQNVINIMNLVPNKSYLFGIRAINHWGVTAWSSDIAKTSATQTSALDTATAALAAIASDSVLSKGEKPAVIKEWNDIAAEYNSVMTAGSSVGVSTATYTAAYSALSTYLTSIAYSNTATDTTIVAATFRTKFSDYYAAKAALQKLISDKAATLATGVTIDSAGNITGIGTGSGASVANNQNSIIRAPEGGLYVGSGGTVAGAIKITLPVFFTNTMLKFTVDIFEYVAGYSCSIEISGYNYVGGPNAWYQVTARVLGGSNVEYPVYFGHNGTKACIWIGDYASGVSWSYPQIRVRDVLLGYSNYTAAMWESGWAISFDNSVRTNVTATVLDTLPGADWAKISGSGKPANNATVGATWGVNIPNVDTDNIEPNAATASDFVSLASQITIPENSTDLPVLSLTVQSTGAPVVIILSLKMGTNGPGQSYSVTLYRGSTSIGGMSPATYGTLVHQSIGIKDTPPAAGTVTYSLKATSSAGNSGTVIAGSILRLELKR